MNYENEDKDLTNKERIMMGECVSPLTTDRCPVCVDHCEASDYNFKIKELINITKK